MADSCILPTTLTLDSPETTLGKKQCKSAPLAENSKPKPNKKQTKPKFTKSDRLYQVDITSVPSNLQPLQTFLTLMNLILRPAQAQEPRIRLKNQINSSQSC
ncbi:hypothetical protein TNCT_458321 [Trichonephila clavata]|uniref:Uncharacterized protein n=1 Tax=Trichonephila clavata TaxID=2740835 RepID=A0A8X6IEF8_TRICU|nr:hypothetical protein TNCT_458321 [Trichonephila clavata]